MKRFQSLLVCVACVFVMTAWPGLAQQSSLAKTPPGPGRGNHRFNIAYPESGKSWSVGKTQATSGGILQTVANTLADRLARKGFTRVRPLDVPCCTIQLELLYVAANEGSSATPSTPMTLSVRVTLLDIDQQNVYTKEYRGEAPAGAVKTGKGTETAAADLVTNVLADNEFLRPLAGS
jgi:hypothetical protein